MKHIPDAVSMLIPIKKWAMFVCEVMRWEIRQAQEIFIFYFLKITDN